MIIFRLDDWYDDDNQQEDDTQRHDSRPLFINVRYLHGLWRNDENAPWHFATTSSCGLG